MTQCLDTCDALGGYIENVTRLLSANESRRVDTAYPVEAGMTILQLMEQAGAAIAHKAQALLAPGAAIALLSGSGQNGGDAWVAARLLAANGFFVSIYDVAMDRPLPAEAEANRRIARALHIPVYDDSAFLHVQASDVDMIIDGVLGAGFHGKRGLIPALHDLFAHVNDLHDLGVFVLAIDVPSGVDATTGAVVPGAIKASETISFVRPKAGLVSHPGVLQQATVTYDALGVPAAWLARALDNPGTYQFSHQAFKSLLPVMTTDRHKGMSGQGAVVAGQMPGATVLATRAMAMTGVGYTGILVNEQARSLYLAALPEALYFTQPTSDFFARFQTIVLGPGLGTVTDDVLAPYLQSSTQLVLDADGLNVLAEHERLKAMLRERVEPAVLTPHPGECRRLGFYDEDDRFKTARTLADAYQSVVVVKGMATVIAAPDGTTLVCNAGNEGLAKAGSGDVLSGIIGGLLAQGLTPLEAACAGVFWHGAAADLAAAARSKRTMLPSDVIAYLPQVLSIETC